MPFGLKNAEATCQRAIVTMFHEHIHKIMEVYIDDILVKSKQEQDHLQALEEVFTIFQRYKIRLKLQNCAFHVISKNLFDFMVSNRGIEVDAKKFKAIIRMPHSFSCNQLRTFGSGRSWAVAFLPTSPTCERLLWALVFWVLSNL